MLKARVKTKVLTRILTLILCSFIFFPPILGIGVSGGDFAAAETSGIMKELEGLKIDGKEFDVANYPADAEGVPQVLNLYEVGYSYYADKQDDYSLLLYAYVPSQKEIKDDGRNTVQMITGNAERPAVYGMKLLEASSDRLFYKFRVDFTEAEKAYVLTTLDKESRSYDVNTVELYESGPNATSYPIERLFVYTGYGKGFGMSVDGEDCLTATLNYTVKGGTETEKVEAYHTTWRPDGSKQGAGKYVQESLHSIYFAIPNSYADQYDYLKSVHVKWLEALTSPIFVTGNAAVHEAVNSLILFQTLKYPTQIPAPEEFDFSFFKYALGGGVISEFTNDVGRNFKTELSVNESITHPHKSAFLFGEKKLKALYWLFGVEGNAKDHVISSTQVLNFVNAYHPFINDKKVADKYPSYLFESWADEKHEEVIEVGKEYTLKSEKIVQSWWEKLWNGNHVEDKKLFEHIDAIQEVESITGNTEVDCASYYIGESDYPEFKEFYNANKNKSTVYLLRFATSDYTQMQALVLGPTKNFFGQEILNVVDQNSYFAQTKVFLDFDVIALEFAKKNKSYIIPVNMSPIDIFPVITPPVYWDENTSDFWKYGVAMIIALVGVEVVQHIIQKAVRGSDK